MRRVFFIAAIVVAVLAPNLAMRGVAASNREAASASMFAGALNSQHYFVPNRGQNTSSSAAFTARIGAVTVELSSTGAVFTTASSAQGPRIVSGIGFAYLGANARARFRGLDRLPTRLNFFLGSDPSRWRVNVPTFSSVIERSVYPGVDLRWRFGMRALEYDWIVHPGADLRRIVMQPSKGSAFVVGRRGGVVLGRGGMTVIQQRPMAYQTVQGARHATAVGFLTGRGGSLRLRAVHWKRSYGGTVDPPLSFRTLLGGGEVDQSTTIAVDGQGNVYVAGSTTSTQFPVRSPVQDQSAGQIDAFISKLDPTGTVLENSTYLGGSDDDVANSLAIAANGSLYVTGETRSSNFPTSHAYQPAFGGGGDCLIDQHYQQCGDAFVVHLNPAGNQLLYSTFLGTKAEESGNGIAVDTAGNAFVAGGTESTSFPQVHGLPPTDFESNGCQNPEAQDDIGCRDAFVTKFSPDGSTLVYSTLVGGNNDDVATAIAVDMDGAAWITGESASVDFPQVNTSLEEGASGDAFVLKLNSGGNDLLFSTFVGGSGEDQGNAIALDSHGNASVVGETTSDDFPTSHAVMPDSPGDQDAWIAKFPSTGGAPFFITFTGGNRFQQATGVAVDYMGDVYVAGNTDSPNFPVSNALQPVFGGDDCAPTGTGDQHCYDAFVEELDPLGQQVIFSTYFGGSNSDLATGIALDSVGNIYITGVTSSDDLPSRGGASLGQMGDVSTYVAKLGDKPFPTATPTATVQPTLTATPISTSKPSPTRTNVHKVRCRKNYRFVHGKCRRKKPVAPGATWGVGISKTSQHPRSA